MVKRQRDGCELDGREDKAGRSFDKAFNWRSQLDMNLETANLVCSFILEQNSLRDNDAHDQSASPQAT